MGFEIASNKEFTIERQVELELDLEPGEYVVVPRISSCNIRKPDKMKVDSITRLLDSCGELDPLADLIIKDIFRRLDKITLDNSLSFAELSDFFSRLSLTFTESDYKSLLHTLSPTYGILNRSAFL